MCALMQEVVKLVCRRNMGHGGVLIIEQTKQNDIAYANQLNGEFAYLRECRPPCPMQLEKKSANLFGCWEWECHTIPPLPLCDINNNCPRRVVVVDVFAYFRAWVPSFICTRIGGMYFVLFAHRSVPAVGIILIRLAGGSFNCSFPLVVWGHLAFFVVVLSPL